MAQRQDKDPPQKRSEAERAAIPSEYFSTSGWHDSLDYGTVVSGCQKKEDWDI